LYQLREIKDIILLTHSTPSSQQTAVGSSSLGTQPTHSFLSPPSSFAQAAATPPGAVSESARALAKERATAHMEIQDHQVLVTLDKTKYNYYKAGDSISVHMKAKSIAKKEYPGEEEMYKI
jgi:hypothetical protein